MMMNITPKKLVKLSLCLAIVGYISYAIGHFQINKNIASYNQNLELGEFNKLFIDLNVGNVEIKSGDYNLEIFTHQDNIKVDTQNNVLSITANSSKPLNLNNSGIISGLLLNKKYNDVNIILTIPPDKILEQANINIDIGKLNVGQLLADTANITNNVGDINIDYIKANDLDIFVDIGKILITHGIIDVAKLQTNVGDISASANFINSLTSVGDIGKIQITTPNPYEYYQYILDVDIGSASINGFKPETNTSGNSKMVLQTNVGNIEVITN